MSLPLNVPMRFDEIDLLWTVDDVLSQAECKERIEFIERSKPEIATNNPIYRNQDRVIEDSIEFSDKLFFRIKHKLPQRIDKFSLVGLNPRFRYYRYSAGQQFAPHMDHWYQPSESEITLLTVLIYLNADFNGGETQFMEQLEKTIKPHPGLAAVFQHKIRHEGKEVMSGTKYAVRTDVIYKKG